MAGQNDFLIFDENKDNMLTQELYSVDGDRTDGFKKGLARSNVNNKVLHQTSMMCNAIGELAKEQGLVASDEGSVDNLKNVVKQALGGADKDLSNLTEAGEKHFLNKNQITNCILEAPNGVYEVINDGNAIKIKAGLKILMPNGLNSDGTLKNLIYSVEEDFVINNTWGVLNGRFDLFIDSNNRVGIGHLKYLDWVPNVYIGEFILVNQFNQLYYWDTSTGQYKIKPIPLANIGRVVLANGLIENYSKINTTNVLKVSDFPIIASISLPSIDGKSIILAASGSVYTAQNNGWIIVAGTSLNQAASIHLLNLTTGYEVYSPAAYNSSLVTASMPITVGNRFQLDWFNTNIHKFLIKYAEGVA